MKISIMALLVILLASPLYASDAPYLFINKAYWDKFDWSNVKKSEIYKLKSWSPVEGKSDNIIRVYKGIMSLVGNKVDIGVVFDNTINSYRFTISETSDRNRLATLLALYKNEFGESPVVYDGKSQFEDGLYLYVQEYQWHAGTTAIIISVAGSATTSGDSLLIFTRYENLKTAKPVKPLTVIKCSYTLQSGEITKQKEEVYLFDEQKNLVENMDFRQLAYDVNITNDNIHMHLGESVKGLKFNIDINRITGKMSGIGDSENSLGNLKMEGQCEKYDISQKKF